MRLAGRKARDEWLPNCYPSRTVGECRVRVSRAGRMILLTPGEDEQLEQVFMSEDLFRRLERTGHIITPDNARTVFEALRTWHTWTYAGPALHIVSVTKRCNLDCSYCHMLPEPVGSPGVDLQPGTAEAIARFALSTPNENCRLEFQGGEPFLNFPGVVAVVEAAERINRAAGKKLSFTLVSNLMVARDEHLQYCRDHRIAISYTLNGTQATHDRYRRSRSGQGSFDQVVQRIRAIESRYPGLLSASPLCTIGDETIEELRAIVDFFDGLGFRGLSLQRLKPLGNATARHGAFDMPRYIERYLQLVDYMFEKNRTASPPFYSERMMRVVLSKVLADVDVGFVDWRNPCGDVLMTLTYDWDGEILPSDEARSLRGRFSLGNVRTMTYDELVRRDATFETTNLSLRDRDAACRECAYNPYCGVLPVLDYAERGDPTPLPHQSAECLFTIAALDWAFRKYQEDPVTLVKMLPGIERALPALVGAAGPPA